MMPVNRFESSSGPPPENGSGPGGPEALEQLQRQLEELGEYARLYVAARRDAIVGAARRAGLWLIVGCVALVMLVALIATASAVALLGLAELIGQSLGERLWAGYLITGFGFLAICLGGLIATVYALVGNYRRKMVKKYARKHQQQRARFGHDSAQAARGSERG